MALAAPLGACVPQPIPGAEGSDANALVLRPGFTSRIIGIAGQNVPGTGHEYSLFPDGGATFVDPLVAGGWYYVANHEIPLEAGGVTSFRFAPDGTIVDAFPICVRTSINCAGGATPWGTWLTCEEYDGGLVWECDPTRAYSATPRPRLGVFCHEAAAVASDNRIYLTEDRPDGAFYRFTPDTPGDLTAGVLELACAGPDATTVRWERVPDPLAQGTPCRFQVPGTLPFRGGEGIGTADGIVWFTTKGDDRVWEYHVDTAQLTVRFEASGTMLGGVDNLFVAPTAAGNALLVAEDGDDMQIVALLPDNTLMEVVRIVGHEGSEVTGPALSPDRTRLYFSSQRGPVPSPLGPTAPGFIGGITYEVTGPFDELLAGAI